jgi:hypothetical protein
LGGLWKTDLSFSAKMPSEVVMTTPAAAIKDEVRVLIDIQVRTFGQPAPLTASQLSDFHYRFQRFHALCQELNRLSTQSVIEDRLRNAA